MDRLCRRTLIGLAMAVMLLSSCAPTPPAVPTVVSTPQSAPASVSATLAPKAEDAAWAKVVSDAKKEGLLTIYSFYFVADIGRSLAQAFQQKYGIKVEVMPTSGTAAVSRIRVENKIKQPIADILQSGTSSATEIVVDGLGDSVSRELPELRDRSVFVIDPVYSPGGELLFMGVSILGNMINTNLVKPQDEPKSWKDLLDPKWKGKILATDPRTGGGGTFTWWTVSRSYKVLDDDYWRRLAPQLTLFGGSDQEAYNMVARGEYHIQLIATPESVSHLIAEGAPLKILPMDEGHPAQGVAIVKVKGGPHPNAAKLFLDWIMSADGQDIYGRAARVSSVRKDVRSYFPPGASLLPRGH